MPRYYFHLRHGSQLTIDAEGEDFPDDDAARAEAAEAVHEILAEAIFSKQRRRAGGDGDRRRGCARNSLDAIRGCRPC